MHSHQSAKTVLAGDIGGTKTSLGFFIAGPERPQLLAWKTYQSPLLTGLEEAIDDFLRNFGGPVSAACFGIAGPFVEGTSKTTNLPWVVSETLVEQRYGWRTVRLMNDLEATALAVPLLTEEEVRPLNEGIPVRDGTVAVVAPGTGLGMALGAFMEGKIHALPSEGGHVDFAPKNERELDLLRHLLRRMPHVSVERLVSGPGLVTIYSWLKECQGYSEPAWLVEKMKSGDAAAAISQAALQDQEPLCVEALDLFVSILGAVAGNLALTALTVGGLYLGGGICPKIMPKLEDGSFMGAFTAKGRFRVLLCTIPVRVILNEQAALLGAASWALDDSE